MLQALALGLVLWITSAAQESTLPPDMVLLGRIKAHMAEQLDHLPNYTCLETISRFSARRDLPLKPQDVVRLEIVYSDRNEWFASPGDATFSSTHPSEFTAGGLTANGTFALTLHNIFLSYVTTFTWRGEAPDVGPRAVRYDFRIPAIYKPLNMSFREASGVAGEAGSFWIDRDTLDLLAVTVRAIEIDPLLPVRETSTRVAYARTDIGGHQAILPQSADLQLLRTNGELRFDRFDFTHCRAFQTTSVLHFGSASDSSTDAPVHPPAAVTGVVPPFLPVTVRLTSPITDRDAVGAAIAGRTEANMVHKGKVVVPAGSILRGRIRGLDRFDANTFAVSLEFTEVEVDGVRIRFFADFTGLDRSKEFRRRLSEKIEISAGNRTATVTVPPLYGVASFFVTGRSFTLPAGFKTMWRTRGLLR